MSNIRLPHADTTTATRQARGNARVLAACQAIYTASISVDLTLTALVGYALAPNESLATVPFALITVTAALTTLFASLLMQKIGRRVGFALGASVGGLGGGVSVWAIVHQSFLAFCAGTAAVGVFQAFARYYRLAAADGIPAVDKSKVISRVMAGGVAAAVAGPAITVWSSHLLSPVRYAGSYIVVAFFGFTSALLVMLFYRNVDHDAHETDRMAPRPSRRLRAIVRQPIFVAALANNAIGNAVMMFIMTATPLAAIAAHHSVDNGASIIQWHLVGMYAPALFSGQLIRRFGAASVAIAGAILTSLCGLIAMGGTSLPHFYAALLCLGVGWNFMFVAGSTLLTRSHAQGERAKTQGLCEFLTFMLSAFASALAGDVLSHYGWWLTNALTFPLLIAAAGLTIWWALAERGSARTAAQRSY